MNRFLWRVHVIRAAAIAAIAGISFSLSACSGDEVKREYAVPRILCGTPIDVDDVSPFLRSGRKLSAERTSPDRGVKECDVRVDGKLSFETMQAWWEKGTTTRDFGRGQTLDDPDRSAGRGRYLYSGYQAFGKAEKCVNPEFKGQVLFTALQVYGSKHRDADAMKRLIISYTKTVERSSVCR